VTPESDPSSFRLPRLRIDRDGGWFHDDDEVLHEGILESLRQGLEVDAAGHFLQIGPVRVPVEVEDAPFSVVRLEADGEGFVLTLNDMSREPLDPATLRLGVLDAPYCRVKGSRFEARFTRAAAWQLLQHVVPGEAGSPATVTIGGRRYAFGA